MRNIAVLLILLALLSASEQPRAETAPEWTIKIAAVGDIMMGTTYPEDSNYLPPYDGTTILAGVKDPLAAADITIGNLEGCLLNGGTPAKDCEDPASCYVFRSPEHYVGYLAEAGFDVMSLANNHARDFGEEGMNRTRELLDSVGIKYSGLIGDVAKLEHDGKTIAVIAFATYDGLYNLLDIPLAESIVAGWSAMADIVVVSFHGGIEGIAALHVPDSMEVAYGEDRGELRKFARAVIDAGADLVVGHGPHVPRGMEIYKNRLIAYSLGNFCTYAFFNLKAERSLTCILTVELTAEGELYRGRAVPVVQELRGIPRLDEQNRVIPVLQRLSQSDFGDSAPFIGDDGLILHKLYER